MTIFNTVRRSFILIKSKQKPHNKKMFLFDFIVHNHIPIMISSDYYLFKNKNIISLQLLTKYYL